MHTNMPGHTRSHSHTVNTVKTKHLGLHYSSGRYTGSSCHLWRWCCRLNRGCWWWRGSCWQWGGWERGLRGWYGPPNPSTSCLLSASNASVFVLFVVLPCWAVALCSPVPLWWFLWLVLRVGVVLALLLYLLGCSLLTHVLSHCTDVGEQACDGAHSLGATL
jgi:hypothetical protein